ncbi:MAG: hypothetical protein IBJ13_11720 [Sphingopyxis sp.]|nr:hypothetical protein [Sphingopyxis sp.]
MASIDPEHAERIAGTLFDEFNTLGRIWSQSPEALARVLGKNSHITQLLLAARGALLEAMRCDINRTVIDTADPALGQYLVASMGSHAEEMLRVLFLDGTSWLIADELMQWGTVGQLTLHPRTIFRRAMEHNAAGIILVHNHPSGDPTPSESDIDITERLRLLGLSLDVTIVDHIIVTANDWRRVPSPENREGRMHDDPSRRSVDGYRFRDGSQSPDFTEIERVALCNAKRTMQRHHLRLQMVGAPSLFGDPAWQMLTDLFIHECEGKHVATGSLCIAAGVPSTTALRLLHRLCDAGIVRRRPDPNDGRRQFIELSSDIRRKLLAYFAAL